MTSETHIRTNKDGSINTAHYMARGRLARSQQAHKLSQTATTATGTAVTRLAVILIAVGAALPFAF